MTISLLPLFAVNAKPNSTKGFNLIKMPAMLAIECCANNNGYGIRNGTM
jgi:hypothetical protein